MAQDYWHGGWANQTQEDLPGTKAARMSGSYGAWNALADILGAYWSKRQQDGAVAQAEALDNEMDALGQQTDGTWSVGDKVTVQNPAKADFQFTGQRAAPSTDAQADPSMRLPNPQPAQMTQPLSDVMDTPQERLSYMDYADRANALKAKYMREAYRKYGAQGMGAATQMIDDIINRHTTAYGNQELDRMRQGLYGGIDINTPQGEQELWRRVGEYNILANRTGGQAITPDQIRAMRDAGAESLSNINTGNEIKVMASPKSGGHYKNGESMREVDSFPLKMSPYQSETLQFNREGRAIDQANKDRDYQLQVARVQDSIRRTEAYITDKLNKAQGNGTTLTQPMVGRARLFFDDYKAWKENPDNWDKPDTAYPRYYEMQDAINALDGAGGGMQAPTAPTSPQMPQNPTMPNSQMPAAYGSVQSGIRKALSEGAPIEAIVKQLEDNGFTREEIAAMLR